VHQQVHGHVELLCAHHISHVACRACCRSQCTHSTCGCVTGTVLDASMLPPLTSTCVSNAARQERIAAAAHQNGAEQKPMIFSSCLFNDPSAPTFYNLEESGEEWQAPKNVASAAAMQSREQRPDLPEPPPLATACATRAGQIFPVLWFLIWKISFRHMHLSFCCSRNSRQ
jgi:hypothetical protein